MDIVLGSCSSSGTADVFIYPLLLVHSALPLLLSPAYSRSRRLI